MGKWRRPDGGCILQFDDPGLNGRLEPSYFNPRPIHAGRAEWKHPEGYLGACVEPRAPNYPGSTYTLAYDSMRDGLVGVYFQAALKQPFEIEVERIP